MALPSIRLRSVPLFSLALLEVVPSPLLLPTTYESCIHEDSVATVEAGSQKQIRIRWPDQETQETQGFFSFCGRRRWRRQRFRRTQGFFSFCGRGRRRARPAGPRPSYLATAAPVGAAASAAASRCSTHRVPIIWSIPPRVQRSLL